MFYPTSAHHDATKVVEEMAVFAPTMKEGIPYLDMRFDDVLRRLCSILTTGSNLEVNHDKRSTDDGERSNTDDDDFQ